MNKKLMTLGISAAMLSTSMMSLTSCQETQRENPLLQESTLPFGAPDFSKIQPTDYLPAFEAAIQQNRDEIANIVENQDSATFENTILAFEESGKTLDRVSRVFFAIVEADKTDEISEIEKKVQPMLTDLENEISFNKALFERIRQVYDRDHDSLQGEDQKLLEETYKDFVQMGAARRFSLRIPNREIEHSFLKRVVGAYVGQDSSCSSGYAFAAGQALYAHDVAKFLKSLKAFFSDIPYDMTDRQNEQMWQTICYVVLRSIGINVNGEVKTHDGRMDMVVDLPNDIYIVEFKLDRPAAEAMEQIKGKEYAGKYALSGKRITLVGISFSSEKRTIVDELVEEIPA